MAPSAALPALPKSLPSEALPEAILLRICRSAQATREPAFRATGTYRFDAPDGSYGTCYAARDFKTCFFETVVRDGGLRIPRSEYDSRSVLVLVAEMSKLHLVPIHGDAAKRLGLNLAHVSSDSYANTQALSKAIYQHPDRPHGIVYRSRFDDDALAVVLFDRAKALVRLFPSSVPTALAAVPELGNALRSIMDFELV
jgi:hypothetical protein